MTEQPILTYKVVVVGDGSVGKTSLIRRFTEGKFEASRIMTLGVDFQTKLVKLKNQTVKLSIWDIAGQDKFGGFRETFYAGAQTAALVYDVSSPVSFLNLQHWQQDLRRTVPDCPLVVIANKSDLPGTVPVDEAQSWAKSENMPFLQTSALTGQNVESFFLGLAHMAAQPPKTTT